MPPKKVAQTSRKTPSRAIDDDKARVVAPPKAAVKRSTKVANDYAYGTRRLPKEGVALPPDVTPLDVMLMAMHRAYALGGSLAAAPYAEKAAPYIHGKISTIELKRAAGQGGDSQSSMPYTIEFVEPDVPLITEVREGE